VAKIAIHERPEGVTIVLGEVLWFSVVVLIVLMG
jgi:hypothetical protein